MRRAMLPILFLTTLLVSCAPRATLVKGDDFRTAFSEAGVAWVSGGQACYALAPQFQTVCPEVGRAVDVAWHGGEAWAGIPLRGQIVTLTGAARSVTVGAVQALSSQAVYRQDGSVLNYAGAAAGDVFGSPQEALTGGDGLDYVRVNGELRRAADRFLVTSQPGAYLVRTPTGVTTSALPAVETLDGLYRVTPSGVEWFTAGQVRKSVAGVTGRVGVVGQWVVTISQESRVRVFTPSLQELAR